MFAAQQAAVNEGVGQLRIARERGGELDIGRRGVSLLPIDGPQVVVRLGPARPQFQRSAQIGDRERALP